MERSGLHVPDVALDAGNPQRNLTLESAIDLGDGVALDAVADLGSGRVGFDLVEIDRGSAGTGRGLAHQLHLGVTGRRADEPARRQTDRAVGRAGRVHRRRLDHRLGVCAAEVLAADRLPVAVAELAYRV